MQMIFIGDSLTAGYGDTEGLGWAGRLAVAAMRAGNDLTWYNLGIRANTSTDIRQRCGEELGRRTMEGPMRTVLSMGAADIARGVPFETTDENARTLLDDLTQVGPVLLIGPPPALRDGYEPAAARLDELFSTLARERGIPYGSSLHLLRDRPGYLEGLKQGDGIHPDAAGYALWAELLLADPDIQRFINSEQGL